MHDNCQYYNAFSKRIALQEGALEGVFQITVSVPVIGEYVIVIVRIHLGRA